MAVTAILLISDDLSLFIQMVTNFTRAKSCSNLFIAIAIKKVNLAIHTYITTVK
jgi:hypothetical protein